MKSRRFTSTGSFGTNRCPHLQGPIRIHPAPKRSLGLTPQQARLALCSCHQLNNATLVRQRRILIVDDSATDIELLLLAFGCEKITHAVDVVRTAREAIFYLAKSASLPALVLLDLKLPDTPGLELLHVLRGDEKLKGLPVVVLSGSERLAAGDLALETGANAFLNKPVSFTEFQQIIAQVRTDWLSE
jgi:CheY-like chemotaxis protein